MSFNFEFLIIWILSELHIGVGKDRQLRTGILEKKRKISSQNSSRKERSKE